MPRRYAAGAARETTDLHAPWWSEAKDASGRYLERAVVYTRLTYADSKVAERALFASMSMEQVLSLANTAQGSSPDAAASEIAQRLDSTQMLAIMDQSDVTLLVRLAELTDETGAALPLRDASGRLLPDAEQVLADLDAEDMNFIRAEVQKLDAQDAVVPVLPEDAERAAAGHPSAGGPEGRGAAGVAEATFRDPGETGAA